MTTHVMDKSKRQLLAMEIAKRMHDAHERLEPKWCASRRDGHPQAWDELPWNHRMLMADAVEEALAGYIVFKGAPGLERRHRGERRST